MAPFPDEVDVFTGPHWRMKQLVGLYCEKVCTNNCRSLILQIYEQFFGGLCPKVKRTPASMLAS